MLVQALSESYTEKWGVPVPLSFNAYKEGRQRFLNLRVGGCSLTLCHSLTTTTTTTIIITIADL